MNDDLRSPRQIARDNARDDIASEHGCARTQPLLDALMSRPATPAEAEDARQWRESRRLANALGAAVLVLVPGLLVIADHLTHHGWTP